MSNGRLKYGSTTYDFVRNYSKDPSVTPNNDKITRFTTDGTPRVKLIYKKTRFELSFYQVSATQKSALFAADEYSGVVEFYPTGASGDHYINGTWEITNCVPHNNGKYSINAVYIGTLGA